MRGGRGNRSCLRRLARPLFALVLALGPPTAPALDWSEPWRIPRDAHAAATRGDEYAWRVFVALNWPADAAGGPRGEAARSGDDGPTVWETWPTANQVYREDGADPGPPDSWQPLGASFARFEVMSTKEFQNPRHIVAGVMVPLTDPVAAAARLTEIRMNAAAYNYIRGRELYNLDGQIKAYAAREPIEYPADAKEIKAKWRPISEAERLRYHSVRVTLADGTQRLYGLTALHIASKDLPSWFWATFEHVDNPSRPESDGWRLPSRDTFGCRGLPASCNRAPRGIGLDGTIWQYYRLRGTLSGFVDSAGRPRLLANSELEAGMQETSSCITCHSRATIGVMAGRVQRLPIFDRPEGAPAGRGPGFVGLPRAEWFAAGEAGARPPSRYRQLDFDWSLVKAQPRAP